MSCHASRHAHLDSRDLRWPAVRKIHPYARLTCLTVSDDPVRRQRVAQTELERAHVGDKISSLAETGDRISDELSWPVVGDVATSVDAVDRNTPTPKHFGCDEQVIDRSAPTDRVDRIVLEEKQPLGSAGADARRDGFLESPRVQIIGPRKPGRAQRRAHKTGVSARGTCRSAWYDERTRGPDSTWRYPIANPSLRSSGRSARTTSSAAASPSKSGISTSTDVPGDRRRISRIVAAKSEAPPSASSSRFTLVTTACPRAIWATASPTRTGSSRSTTPGRPVLTAQNPHDRVQVSPRIMKVAVPAPQHSDMVGQW